MEHILNFKLFEAKVVSDLIIKKRWAKKRDAIKTLQRNILKLRRKRI